VPREPTEWQKILACYTTHRRLIFRLDKKELSIKTVNNPVNKWNGHFPKKKNK
jgi:hypothetical protein